MSFTLAEEAVLLGLDDDTGKCVSRYASYTHSAAIIADLGLRGLVTIHESHLEATGATSTGDPLLDDAIACIRSHHRKLRTWIRTGPVKEGRAVTLKRLVDRGILEYVENTVLGLFHFRRYPAHDRSVENAIRERLRKAAQGHSEPDAHTRALLSIARGADLVKTFLNREEMKKAAPHIKELTGGESVGAALEQVIQEDEAAATTAAIIAATT